MKALVITVHADLYLNIEATRRRFGTIRKIKRKKDLPDRYTIRSLISKFENTGSVFNQAHSGRKSHNFTREDVAPTVLGSRLQSSYKMADQVGVSQLTIWGVLKNEIKLFPYKLKFIQSRSEKNFC